MKGENVVDYAIVDEDTYSSLVKYHWMLMVTVKHKYAVRTPSILMHREIMQVLDSPSWVLVDHKDRNGLNNQRSNLRVCTYALNVANSPARTGRYKGVSISNRAHGVKWRATITYKGIQYHLGYFYTEEEAAIAYDLEARKLFGEYAILNFPVGS